VDFTAERRPNIHPTLPWLVIQNHWQTAFESEVSSEWYLYNFDVIPTRKRHLAHCQCLPCDGTTYSAVPCNGSSFRVKNRIPWWRRGSSHCTCLVVSETERKHDDRYNFYRYFTIPVFVAILLTIKICNGFRYSFRKLILKIHCTTPPVVNSTQINQNFRQKFHQNSNLLPVSYNPTEVRKSHSLQTVVWSRDFQSTEQPRRVMRVNYFFLVSFSTAKKQRKSPNAWEEVRSANVCVCQIYVSRDKKWWFEW